MPATLLIPPAIEDATRREFLGILTAAGLLAGCSADSDDEPAPAAATRTVTHRAW